MAMLRISINIVKIRLNAVPVKEIYSYPRLIIHTNANSQAGAGAGSGEILDKNFSRMP
jgi:hypothetical protein